MVRMWLHGRPASTRRVYEPIVGQFLQHVRSLYARSRLGFAILPVEPICARGSHPIQEAERGQVAADVRSQGRLPGCERRRRSADAQDQEHTAERILSEADVQRMIRLEPNARNRMMLRLLTWEDCGARSFARSASEI